MKRARHGVPESRAKLRRGPAVPLSPRPSPMRTLPLVLLVLALPARAQGVGSVPPRFGVGLEVSTAVFAQDLVPDGAALGLRARAALPVNADISVAASLGVASHLFDGRDDAALVLNPQTSVIVTLPGEGAARYVLGGVGGFIPLDEGGGGPALHAGYGVAFPLYETALFLEVNPSLILGEGETTPVLAVRGGVIF